MSTAPPIARDRLVGLAEVPKSLVNAMEKEGLLGRGMNKAVLNENLRKIAKMIVRLIEWFLKFAPKTYREERVISTLYGDARPYEPFAPGYGCYFESSACSTKVSASSIPLRFGETRFSCVRSFSRF